MILLQEGCLIVPHKQKTVVGSNHCSVCHIMWKAARAEIAIIDLAILPVSEQPQNLRKSGVSKNGTISQIAFIWQVKPIPSSSASN